MHFYWNTTLILQITKLSQDFNQENKDCYHKTNIVVHNHVESTMNMHNRIKPIPSTCKKQIHQTSLEKKKDPLTSLAKSKEWLKTNASK